MQRVLCRQSSNEALGLATGEIAVRCSRYTGVILRNSSRRRRFAGIIKQMLLSGLLLSRLLLRVEKNATEAIVKWDIVGTSLLSPDFGPRRIGGGDF